MKFLSFLICFITLIQNLIGQDTLSIEQCIQIATDKNLLIYKQRNQENTYKLNIKSAHDNYLPTISAYTNANNNWGRGIDPFTNTYVNQQFSTYNGGINASLNLFNGFYDINNVKLQKINLSINQSEWENVKRSLAFDIGLRYTNILYLEEMVQNIKKQLSLSMKNIEYTQIRIDAGIIAKREIYKAISQKENEELNLLQTENSLETNKLELLQILGKKSNETIHLKQVLTSDIPVTKQEIMSIPLDNFPKIQIQKNNLNKAILNKELIKSNYYPKLSLNSQIGSTYSSFNKLHTFNEQIDNNLSYGFSLNANFPIFNQWQTRNQVKKSEFDIISAKINYESELNNQYKELNKAYLDYSTSNKKLILSTNSLKSNQINYETDVLKYEAGKITLQDLNISKSNLFSSLSNQIKDKYESFFNSMVMKIYIEGNK